jgi:gas vesicle protein
MVGVVLGSIIGAAAALLYAPQAGTETRRTIRSRADQARERASEVTHKVQHRVEEATGQARHRVDELRSQAVEVVGRGKEWSDRQRQAVRSAVDAGKRAYTETKSELHEHGAPPESGASDAAASLRDLQAEPEAVQSVDISTSEDEGGSSGGAAGA